MRVCLSPCKIYISEWRETKWKIIHVFIDTICVQRTKWTKQSMRISGSGAVETLQTANIVGMRQHSNWKFRPKLCVSMAPHRTSNHFWFIVCICCFSSFQMTRRWTMVKSMNIVSTLLIQIYSVFFGCGPVEWLCYDFRSSFSFSFNANASNLIQCYDYLNRILKLSLIVSGIIALLVWPFLSHTLFRRHIWMNHLQCVYIFPFFVICKWRCRCRWAAIQFGIIEWQNFCDRIWWFT